MAFDSKGVIKELDRKEGCHLIGYFFIKKVFYILLYYNLKVPGNFHISSHA